MNGTSQKKFSIELGTTLQLKIQGSVARLKGVLVGMVPEEYLIIRGDFTSLTGRLHKGRRISGRYLYEGTICEFHSELIEFVDTHRELAFIQYPDKIETSELRSHRRVGCFLPAELTIGTQEYRSVILDLSEGGCKCVADVSKEEEAQSIRLNGQVTVGFGLPGVEGKHTIVGDVKGIQFVTESDTEETRLGIKFREVAPEVKKKISDFISSIELH
ncbi:MAG: PilZ domain-containing protein [Deltaproteobacteria bacterium]|nr:PilZ domain-containing protein [Deltaproteobacteria bacterium]